MNMIEQRDSLIAKARAIAEKAKTAGRQYLTDDETKSVNESLDEANGLTEKIAKAKGSADLIARIGALPDGQGVQSSVDGGDPMSGGYDGAAGSFLDLTAGGRKSLGRQVAGKMIRASQLTGAKALLPSGEISTAPEMLPTSPIALGRQVPGFLSVLPVVVHGSARFQYLRQNARVNNAAPVAPGALKPTSVLGLAQITADLQVVAHVSEGIDKYWLEDSTALQQFVGDELLYGLNQALENQVLNGTGTGVNMTGLLNTSGILLQPAIAGDLLGTFRAAVTSMETAGHNPSVFVVNPVDWARVELTKATGTGDYLIDSSPVDRAARKLWGIPVALTTSMTAGTAALIDTASIALDTDRAGIRIQWSENVGDDFSRNQLRARCEGRFAVSVYQGTGAVKVTLPAAA